jgi:Sulfotransferase domain
MKLRFGKDRVSLRRFLGLKRDVVPRGYTHINQFLPDDVFIVGYPKSGNTWFQYLVSGIVHGVDPRTSPPLLANDLVPDVHFNAFYRRYSTPMFFKSHALPRADYRRVVYLLRDGRDAMVSCLHYLEARRRAKLNFLNLVTGGAPEIPCKWHEHVEAWLQNPHAARLLVIKYEDLVSQPVEQLERFCRFTNLHRERNQLEAVAEAAQFHNLRANEARFGLGRPEVWPADKFFFRRGIVGSYKDEMPLEVLRAFLGDAAETLRQNGYPTDEFFGHDAPIPGPSEAAGRPALVHFPASMTAD